MSDTPTVFIEVPLDMLREIREMLAHLAQDLEVELEGRYPEEQRKQYPSYQRRWDNDMAAVYKAQTLRAALDQFYLPKEEAK